jgi:serine/threonine protein kinase
MEKVVIGTTVGNLRIIAELGRGGMGTVYLAEHIKLGRRFAVKRLSSEFTQESRFRERFFREARHQALLDHPNIVRVTDFVEKNSQYLLVMDYVEGQSLDELIMRQGPLGEKEAISILKDILEALHYAHSKGVIHRDIKPSNVMIDAGRRAHITDFGIAILVGEQRLTRTNSDIGSPCYMSPEQILRPREIDHRSDVYAVGIVSYEMLTAEVPFDAESDFSIKEQHLHAPVPDLRKKNPEINDRLADILLKALEKKPEQRYETCLDFLRSIEDYEKKQSPPDDNSALIWRMFSVSVVTVIVVAIALAVYFRPENDDRDDRRKATNESIRRASEQVTFICEQFAMRGLKLESIEIARKEVETRLFIPKLELHIQEIDGDIRKALSKYQTNISRLERHERAMTDEEFDRYAKILEGKGDFEQLRSVALLKDDYQRYRTRGTLPDFGELQRVCRAATGKAHLRSP